MLFRRNPNTFDPTPPPPPQILTMATVRHEHCFPPAPSTFVELKSQNTVTFPTPPKFFKKFAKNLCLMLDWVCWGSGMIATIIFVVQCLSPNANKKAPDISAGGQEGVHRKSLRRKQMRNCLPLAQLQCTLRPSGKQGVRPQIRTCLIT
jgi:hypothetical protein